MNKYSYYSIKNIACLYFKGELIKKAGLSINIYDYELLLTEHGSLVSSL